MRQWIRSTAWLHYLAIGLAYLLAVQLLRSVSLPYWYLPAGLRLGVILLLPYRFWPSLLLAETAALSYTSYLHVGDFALPWALANLFPRAALVMPVVILLRKHLPGHLGKQILHVNSVRMGLLLACAALSTTFTTIANLVVTHLAFLGTHTTSPPTLASQFGWNFLGDYLGIVMLTPLVLMTHEAIRTTGSSLRRLGRKLVHSTLLLEGLVLGLISFGLLTALGMTATADTVRQITRFAMLIPMAWMAMRYGWRGASVSSLAAGLGIMLSMTMDFDTAALLAETFTAIAATILLPLGAHIDVLRKQERDLARGYRRTQQIARHEVYQAELRLRRMSEVLERSHGELQLSHGRLLHKLRFMLSTGESSIYREELQTIRQKIYRVVDSLSPRDWQKRDLAGALWNGPITQTLEDVGIAYHVKDPEGPLGQLSPDLRLALFRLACEAVAHLITQGHMAAIRLRLRGGQSRDGRGWAVLITQGEHDAELAALGVAPPTQEQVQEWLGATGLGLKGMRDRASLYDGKVHMRVHPTGGAVSILLVDTHEISALEETREVRER